MFFDWRRRTGRAILRLVFPALLVAVFASTTSAQLVISEFRLRGPSSASDEFIEIQNASDAIHTVSAISGTGYGIAASDGLVRCTILNGTVIPARGHWLCINSAAYSLGAYAVGDGAYTTDIPDNAGIALFNNNTGGGSFTLANRFDAVGSTSEANTLYKEGTGYPALTPFSIDYAFVRDNCGKSGVIPLFGACLTAGQVKDTDNNAVDFYFVDTNGTSAGAGQRLGAPGPEGLASPTYDGAPITTALLDPCVAWNLPPNQVRDFTSDPAHNSTFGTLSFRRRFTNNTGGPITRLRFRVVDQTTFPAPSGISDLRTRTSSSIVVAGIDRPPCGTGTISETVLGTTLEQPPAQPNGGAFNGAYSAGTVSLGTPLASGASVSLQFLLGIQQTGTFKLSLILEALPAGGGTIVEVAGATNCPAPGTGRPGPGGDDGGCPAVKGDFNSDGLADIVFRNIANGVQNKVWFMSGVVRGSEAAISPDAADANWVIRGTDDFSVPPDGRTDLVFWNQATGNVEFWLMNGASGTNRVGSPVPLSGGPVLAPNWDLSAVADFNYDGRPDIVWRNVTSQNIVIWTMNGTVKTGSIIPSPAQAVASNWTIVAANDYNNDGNNDLLWYNLTSGNIVTWYMNSAVVRTTGQFTSPNSSGDNNWNVLASADYDNTLNASRTTPDLLWRNVTSGNQVVWHMDFNSTRLSGQFTSPAANTPALSWTIVGPR